MHCKQMSIILQFSKNACSLYVDSQMKSIKEETVSYGHVYQFSLCVNVRSDRNRKFREPPTGNIRIIKSEIIPTEAKCA